MFTRLNRSILNFLKDDDGPTAVEYGIMLALVIIVCIVSITALGTNATNTFTYVGNQVKVKGS